MVGVWFLTLGVIGVVIGPREDWFLGFNVDVVSDVVHFATAGLLAYAGFFGGDGQARPIVAAVGGFYLLASVLGLFAADLFGLVPDGLSVQDKVGGIVLGLVAFWAASQRTLSSVAQSAVSTIGPLVVAASRGGISRRAPWILRASASCARTIRRSRRSS